MARKMEEYVAEVQDIDLKARTALRETPQTQQGAAALMLLCRFTSLMLESWEEHKSNVRD